MEKILPQGEVGPSAQIALAERHENGELLDAMRAYVRRLDPVEGAEAPEEERSGKPQPPLQVAGEANEFSLARVRSHLSGRGDAPSAGVQDPGLLEGRQ